MLSLQHFKSAMPLITIVVFITTIEISCMVRTRYRAGMPVAACRAFFCNLVVWALYAGLTFLVIQR